MADDIKVTTLERMGAEVVEGGNFDVIDELWAADMVDHDPAPDQGPGAAGLKAFWKQFKGAFPDLSIEVDEMVSNDDKLAIAYRVNGTHQGTFEGVEATGKHIEIRGLQLTRHDADGKIVERWGASDVAGILQQVGAL